MQKSLLIGEKTKKKRCPYDKGIATERSVIYMAEKWLLCPACGSKTRVKLRQDTELKNFLLFCPKCKREVLVSVSQFITTKITEPDAMTQSL